MQIKFQVFSKSISALLRLADSTVELVVTSQGAFLVAEDAMIHASYKLPLLSSDGECFSIRFNKKLLADLTIERLVEVNVVDSLTYWNYYNSTDDFIYSVTKEKQNGYCNPLERLQYLQNKDHYVSVPSQELRVQVSLLNRLKLNVNCLSNYVYSSSDNAYFARKPKVTIPNFAASSFYLDKMCSTCPSLVFIRNWIYGKTEDDINIFLNKSRLSATSDIGFLLRKRFTHYAKIKTTNLTVVQKKIDLANKNYACVLDVYKQELRILDKGNGNRKIVVASLPVLKKGLVAEDGSIQEKVVTVKPQIDILAEFQKNLASGDTVSGELSTRNDDLNFPVFKLPNRIIKNLIIPNEAEFYIGDDSICLRLGSGLGVVYFVRVEERE